MTEGERPGLAGWRASCGEVPDSLVIYLFFTTRSVTVNNSYLNHISKGMTWVKVTINMIACRVMRVDGRT